MKRIATAVLSLVLAAPLVGCGKKIGDECQTQFDCNDEDDTRTCDISQPGGYCTIDGCDEQSCPDDSVCLRFFPRWELLSTACDHAAAEAGNDRSCGSHEICLAAGRCAPRGSEFRRCMRTCDDGGDCRDGYECRLVGGPEDTTMALGGGGVRFCAPRWP